MMAALGIGVVASGQLGMSLGTSGPLFACAGTPVIDADGSWAAFCFSSGSWLPLICTMNCTFATETVARMFGFSARHGDAPACVRPDSAAVPHGRAHPDLPGDEGVITSMDMHNSTPEHLFPAAMEGATFSMRYGYDAQVAGRMQFTRIALTGGSADSAAWRQMVSDMMELPVDVPQASQGAAFDAALQALRSLHAGEPTAPSGRAGH